MIRNKINDDMKQAMRDRNEIRLRVLRYVWSEIKNAEIDKKSELIDEETMALLNREVKKRSEAIEQMKQGGRVETVEEEEKQIGILREYLPVMMSREELEKIVEAAVGEANGNFGAVMGKVMGKVKGRADGKMVQEMVKEKMKS